MGGSCRLSTEPLSRSYLLRSALSSCSSISALEGEKLFQNFENVSVRTYVLVKIQFSVFSYRLQLCIYGKCVVDTFLEWMGWHGAWQLSHYSGGRHIPIKHRFRYLPRLSGMSSAGTNMFSLWMMDTPCVLAGTDPTHSRRKKICFGWSKMKHSRVMRSGYTRCRGVFGVEKLVYHKSRLVEIGRWIAYACGVIYELCLNFISEQGKTRHYSLSNPEIPQPSRRIQFIKSISLRPSFYPWMIRYILCWICLRKVKRLIAILFWNWL